MEDLQEAIVRCSINDLRGCSLMTLLLFRKTNRVFFDDSGLGNLIFSKI